ncbi:MAG: Lipopolysaccharide export system ATP-binding protein LptB [Synergistetes bacterium ADurb.BinA166]|nr:MAG: Lipopolysaccharide export system ATP-binding protein LptB [Synergistetes bacterium ADurb.BinA166]
MILHSIKVENWRCILGERSAGPFSEGINILHAPNATGKSTLFEALRCALMDSHSAKGKEVERLRPWGRRLSPVVEVEFTSGGVRYRVRKGFLDSALSLLERMENGAYQPVAKGTDADTMTRALFTKDAPKKGMSRPEHWGILQVLWAPQGMLEVGELSGNLLDDIRTSITAQVVDDRARAVEELLGRRSETWFTPTGKEKSAGPLATLRKEIEDAEGRLEALRMERGEAEASSRRVRALSEREEELRGEVARMEEDRKRLEITRAVATEPKLLMLDETMAGLNPTETKEAMELCLKLRGQGITLIVVEHVMEAIMPISDKVIVLDSGKKIAEGAPCDIVKDEAVIKAYLGDDYNAKC